MVVKNIVGYLYGVDMTRQEAINILLDHFSAGFVRTIEDALNKEWVGLTNNELVDLTIKNAGFPILLAQAIEAKLKEKNYD